MRCGEPGPGLAAERDRPLGFPRPCCRSAGKKVEFEGREYTVEELTDKRWVVGAVFSFFCCCFWAGRRGSGWQELTDERWAE